MNRPQFNHLGKVLDRLDEELPHYPYGGEVNEDGFANISFGSQQRVRGVVRPAAAMDFEIGQHGRFDEETLFLLIRNAHGVDEHDRIIFEGEPWRTVEQQEEFLNDFSMFRLTPDSRAGDGEGDEDFAPIEEDNDPVTDDWTKI